MHAAANSPSAARRMLEATTRRKSTQLADESGEGQEKAEDGRCDAFSEEGDRQLDEPACRLRHEVEGICRLPGAAAVLLGLEV